MKLDLSLNRVELHVHLDGSIRTSTLYELARKKGTRLPQPNLKAFEESLVPKEPCNLSYFLKAFEYILPVIAGDKEAIARVSEEFVEDCRNRSNVCYVETRLAPHILTGTRMSADEVVSTVLNATKLAGVKYNIQVRLILCILRDRPEDATEVLELAIKYRPHGVVGIDLAGDERTCMTHSFTDEIVRVYRQAEMNGIHRTVHAGENGPASAVENAINQLHAERIGHGYSVLQDSRILHKAKQQNIHFELCPTSCIMTGAAKHGALHPLHQFASCGMNYSINTDDPSITGRWLDQELRFCTNVLQIPIDLRQAQINAARSAFLDSEEDKQALVDHVMRNN